MMRRSFRRGLTAAVVLFAPATLAEPTPNKLPSPAVVPTDKLTATPVAPARVPRSLDPVRTNLAATLAKPSLSTSRTRFVSAIDSAIARLDAAAKATSFDARLAAYRDAVDTFFRAYDALRRDASMDPFRASLDRAISDALATLPTTDPIRAVLEGLWAESAVDRAKAAQETAQGGYGAVAAVGQIIESIVLVVISTVIAVATYGQGPGALTPTPVKTDPKLADAYRTLPAGPLDGPAIRAWKAKCLAALSAATDKAKSSAAETEAADQRLKAALAALRALLGDIKSTLKPA